MVLGRARLHRLRKNSMLLAILGGAALQCVRENSFVGNALERNPRKSSPGGATELSPALQRWEKWKERFKSRRDDRVLTHTLQRCCRCIVLNPASAAEGTALAHGRLFPQAVEPSGAMQMAAQSFCVGLPKWPCTIFSSVWSQCCVLGVRS